MEQSRRHVHQYVAYLLRIHEGLLVSPARRPRTQGFKRQVGLELAAELSRHCSAKRHDHQPKPRVLLAPLRNGVLKRRFARAVRTEVAAREHRGFRRDDDDDRVWPQQPKDSRHEAVNADHVGLEG